MNERYLSEIHYPPFKDAVQKAGARSIMTSYNSVNGSPATANDYLLNDLLKKQWVNVVSVPKKISNNLFYTKLLGNK